jgi:phage gpG-like protein
MANTFTSYVVDNDNRFLNAIKQASQMSQDLRVPFGLILADFYKSQQALWKLNGPGMYPPFKNSTGSYRKTEKASRKYVSDNKSRYQEEKLKKYGFDYPLLVASGKLAASLSGPNNPGAIASINPLSLIIGTSIQYGIYHQSDAPRRKIPLRKFLFIGPEAPAFASSDQIGRPTRWVAIMQDFINQQLKKAGLQP